MHLQEIFDLTLTQYQGHMERSPAKFEVVTANG